MKPTFAAALFAASLAVTLVLANQSEVNATPTKAGVTDQLPVAPPAADQLKRCSTSSDCPNSKCKGGRCGGCSTSSDCKYGKCRSSRCGACSTSSDCGGWGKCKSGQCGGCSTSSDCGSFGSCRSGRCERTPY
jgi:hypothetical protein